MNNLRNRKKHDQIIKDIYRYLAHIIAPFISKTFLSANFITILRLPFLILGCYQIIFLTYSKLNLFFIIIGFFIFSFFDALDGEVANLKTKSFLGRWLDPQIDRIGLSLIISSITIYYLNQDNSNLQIIIILIGWSLWWIKITSVADLAYKPKFSDLKETRIKGYSEISRNKEYKSKKNIFLKKSVKLLSLLNLNTYMHMHNIILLLIFSILLKNIDLFVFLFFLRVFVSYLQVSITQMRHIVQYDKRINFN